MKHYKSKNTFPKYFIFFFIVLLYESHVKSIIRYEIAIEYVIVYFQKVLTVIRKTDIFFWDHRRQIPEIL